jgi:hypothetical protein
MLLNQWKQFTEEQVREIYPSEQVEFTFSEEMLEVDDIYMQDSSFRTSGVESYFVSDSYFIATRGVPSHTDDDFPNYSYHLILLNTGLVAKGVWQNIEDLAPQLPGTILVLDNWQEHHVIEDPRLKTLQDSLWVSLCQDSLWVSLCFDSLGRLPTESITSIFKEFLKEESET